MIRVPRVKENFEVKIASEVQSTVYVADEADIDPNF